MGNQVSTSTDALVVQQKKRDQLARLNKKTADCLNSLKNMDILQQDGAMKEYAEICDNVKVMYRGVLERFNKETLAKRAYQIGMNYNWTAAELQQKDKESLCNTVYDYFVKKVQLLFDIKKALMDPLMSAHLNILQNWTKLHDDIKDEALKKQSVVRVNALVDHMNKYYNSLENVLDYLVQDITYKKLTDLVKSTNTLILDGKKKGCTLANAVNAFYWNQAIDPSTRAPYYYRGKTSVHTIPVPTTSLSDSSLDVCSIEESGSFTSD